MQVESPWQREVETMERWLHENPDEEEVILTGTSSGWKPVKPVQETPEVNRKYIWISDTSSDDDGEE
jgi:hypothetical protein